MVSTAAVGGDLHAKICAHRHYINTPRQSAPNYRHGHRCNYSWHFMCHHNRDSHHTVFTSFDVAHTCTRSRRTCRTCRKCPNITFTRTATRRRRGRHASSRRTFARPNRNVGVKHSRLHPGTTRRGQYHTPEHQRHSRCNTRCRTPNTRPQPEHFRQ